MFSLGLMYGMFGALTSNDFTGSALLDMVAVLGALGGSGAQGPVVREIAKQTQRIVDENLVHADGCDPCFRGGSEGEIFKAATAGKIIGQEFEIDGQTFSAEEIIASVIDP